MRVIERRLIVKIQDRTPNALNGITNLLKMTYTSISEDVAAFNSTKSILQSKQHELSASITLIKIIIQHLDINQKIISEFLDCLTTPSYDWIQYSWEEITWPSLELLNYSGPLKKNKNVTIDDRPTICMSDFDLNRFKKQLASLCDRITRLSSSSASTTTSTSGNDTNRSSDFNGNRNGGDDSNNDQAIINENDEYEDGEDDEMKNETSDWVNDDISGTGDVLKFKN